MSENKPLILVVKATKEEVIAERTKLLKNNVKYSDDFVETEDAIYYVRHMDVRLDLDKILLRPEDKVVDKYVIDSWLEGIQKQIEYVKEVAGYKPNNISSAPPAHLSPGTGTAPVMPQGGTAVSGTPVPNQTTGQSGNTQ